MILKYVATAVSVALLAGSAAAAEAPSDAQIAHIAYTAGQIDVAAAEQALAKSKSPQVRAFAETMARDHKAVNVQALALVKKLGVTPEANPISASLTKQANVKAAELAKLDGPAFDRAYIQNEIAYHHSVNAALSDTLIPNARNPELKALLGTGLKLFQEHEQHAKHLGQELR
jgi:putative membrane protein